jgi:hypothetical protein
VLRYLEGRMNERLEWTFPQKGEQREDTKLMFKTMRKWLKNV